jgi:3-isopropylmalate/(R)-2-methylmalate dehydratase large subunit
MGMTIAEKILARASGRDVVKPDEYVTARVDKMLAGEKYMLFHYLSEVGLDRVWDPERIVVLTDHRVPANSSASAAEDVELRRAVKKFGIKYWYDVGRGGICHQVFVEKGHALPGMLITGQDSHTTTYGALNAASTCVDLPESVLVAAKGETWFRVPETILYSIDGVLQEKVMSKDIVLKIAGDRGCDFALYKSIEYKGSTVEALSIAARMTMSNMSVDLGAKFAIFDADEKTLDYVRPLAREPFTPVEDDEDAVYENTYHLDGGALTPMVACPHNISNVRPAEDLEKERIRIDQAFIGSCTNGRLEDLEMAASILKGSRIHPDVRLIIVPASMEVYRQAMKKGVLETLVESQALICNPTCGPCAGGHVALLAPGERCISSTNRNFRGRMGSPDSEVYLASPATVAATAIAGYIVDPRNC